MTLKMNEADWEDILQKHIGQYKIAAAPEQSEFNSVGISTHIAERFAKKYSWEFKLIPTYIGGGVYLRVFHFTPKLDESIKRIDVVFEEEERNEGKEGEK